MLKVSSDSTPPIQVKISPNSIELNRELNDIYRTISYNKDSFIEFLSINSNINTEVTKFSNELNFIISLLMDLKHWGADFEFYRSQLFVTIPNLNNENFNDEARNKLKESLLRLKNNKNTYQTDLSEQEALELLQNGEVSLRNASEDLNLIEIFKSGITTWSMPYRNREGRSIRFVATINKNSVTVPIGLLEVGDEAPINPPRDAQMGLNVKLSEITNHDKQILAQRFNALRKALSPEDLPDYYQDDVSKILTLIPEIKIAGKGRDGNFKEVSRKKKLSYLSRLLSAEAACLGISENEENGFQEGLRVIRDLTVPRINVELVICGALPPFGNLLVGKLIAGMACHPDIRNFVNRNFGIITSNLFNVDKLAKLIPNHGVLLVTTKGLYPGHSSQYSGVQYFGENENIVKLKKIGNTLGQTTSHISDTTVKFANKCIIDNGSAGISKTFGSGGGKRQRTISEALRCIGLPVELSHAYISRPIYAFKLVENLDRVVLFNDEPKWLVEKYSMNLDSGHYEEQALKIWKDKWMSKIQTRVEVSS